MCVFVVQTDAQNLRNLNMTRRNRETLRAMLFSCCRSDMCTNLRNLNTTRGNRETLRTHNITITISMWKNKMRPPWSTFLRKLETSELVCALSTYCTRWQGGKNTYPCHLVIPSNTYLYGLASAYRLAPMLTIFVRLLESCPD